MIKNRVFINELEIVSAVLTGDESQIEIPRLQIHLKSGQTVMIVEDATAAWKQLIPNLKKLNLIQQAQIECSQ